MNDWICSRVITKPLIAPTKAPSASTARMVGTVPRSWCIIRSALATAHSASTAPTERSMPPVRITSVIPMAMIPFSDAKRTMFSRFREVRNTFCPLRTGATIADTIRMTASPNTLWNRSSVRPARRPEARPGRRRNRDVRVGNGDVPAGHATLPTGASRDVAASMIRSWVASSPRQLGAELAVAEHQDAVAHRRAARGARDDAMTMPAPPAASSAHQLVDLHLRPDVDAAGRLVEQQHGRAASRGTSPDATFCWLPPDRRVDEHRRGLSP